MKKKRKAQKTHFRLVFLQCFFCVFFFGVWFFGFGFFFCVNPVLKSIHCLVSMTFGFLPLRSCDLALHAFLTPSKHLTQGLPPSFHIRHVHYFNQPLLTSTLCMSIPLLFLLQLCDLPFHSLLRIFLVTHVSSHSNIKTILFIETLFVSLNNSPSSVKSSTCHKASVVSEAAWKLSKPIFSTPFLKFFLLQSSDLYSFHQFSTSLDSSERTFRTLHILY